MSRFLIQNKLHQLQHKIIFFGIGVSLRDCYNQLVLALGRKPDFLCDNAPEKWDREFFGIKCISMRQLAALKNDAVVVITVRRYEAIYEQLAGLGLENIYVACFDRGYEIVGGIKRLESDHLSCSNISFVNQVYGKWTFITGASRGIGKQISIEMAKLGSNLILHARCLNNLKDVMDACLSQNVQVKSIAAELGKLDQLEAMLDALERDFPPIDILFNNAAISHPATSGIWNISAGEFLSHYSVNTVAPIRICYRLMPSMLKRGFGRVINISSTIQKRPDEMPYACSKAALNKFVFDLAPKLKGTGVMISCVCPGHVRSDMGGPHAPHPVENVIPGALLGAVRDGDVNGRWFIAQDYAELDLAAAMYKDKFYYGQGEED